MFPTVRLCIISQTNHIYWHNLLGSLLGMVFYSITKKIHNEKHFFIKLIKNNASRDSGHYFSIISLHSAK